MQPAPPPADEEDRLAKLHFYGVLDTAPEEAFDRITRIAAHALDAPIALVSLIDRSRQWFKSRVGLDAAETPRDVAFCAHAILGDDVFIVEDALKDPRFSDNPLVANDPSIRFYAGAPLTTHDGFRLGTLCAIDRVPRRLDDAERTLLRDLAGLVIDELELRVAGRLALQELAERRHSEAIKDEFLSVVSHELRTPLTSIRGFLGLLDGGKLGPLADPAKEAVHSALRNALSLGRLVDDLLDLQKLQAGHLEFRFDTVDLVALARQTIDDMAGFAASRNIRIAFQAPDPPAPAVLGDAERLQQVLANLLSNAIKFSPPGETVSVRVDGEPARAAIAISDRGPGVPPEFRERLFTRFAQAGGDDRPKGTGLGLAIARAIVEAHGGTIGCDPKPGAGATFRFVIPAAHAAAGQAGGAPG